MDARDIVISPALRLVPGALDTTAAVAFLLAVGLQESDFRYRKQLGGPARGYWCFERVGVQGVLEHPVSRPLLTAAIARLDHPFDAAMIHVAAQYDAVLAAVLARLLIWTIPEPLPRADEEDEGWRQYLAAWRPGKPRPERWTECWRAAWETARQ